MISLMLRRVILFIYLFLYSSEALAYLDPSVTSYILQGLVALLSGIAIFTGKIQILFVKIFKKFMSILYGSRKKTNK